MSGKSQGPPIPGTPCLRDHNGGHYRMAQGEVHRAGGCRVCLGGVYNRSAIVWASVASKSPLQVAEVRS